MSSRELRRYAKAVKENEQRLKPKQLLVERVTADEPAAKKRCPMSAKRLSGAGPKTALTAEQERWLKDWVLSLRRCDHHLLLKRYTSSWLLVPNLVLKRATCGCRAS